MMLLYHTVHPCFFVIKIPCGSISNAFIKKLSRFFEIFFFFFHSCCFYTPTSLHNGKQSTPAWTGFLKPPSGSTYSNSIQVRLRIVRLSFRGNSRLLWAVLLPQKADATVNSDVIPRSPPLHLAVFSLSKRLRQGRCTVRQLATWHATEAAWRNMAAPARLPTRPVCQLAPNQEIAQIEMNNLIGVDLVVWITQISSLSGLLVWKIILGPFGLRPAS